MILVLTVVASFGLVLVGKEAVGLGELGVSCSIPKEYDCVRCEVFRTSTLGGLNKNKTFFLTRYKT